MFYVLDQGMMRSPQLIALIQCDAGARFVIPDMSLVEMLKSAEWETTMRRSLASFVPALSRIYSSVCVGEAIRIERTSRRPVTRDMLLMEDGTRWLRVIVKALSGTSGKSDITSWIEDLRPSLVREELDAAMEKQTIQRIVNALMRDGGARMVADLRNGRMDHAAQLGAILNEAPRLLKKFEPVSPFEARGLIASQSLLLRYYYVKLHHALWWVRRSGLQTADPKTVLNHRLDQEYILIGSFFDATLSKDRTMKELDSDLRALLNRSRAREFQRAYSRYARTSKTRDGSRRRSKSQAAKLRQDRRATVPRSPRRICSRSFGMKASGPPSG
jgi:hypothetical protein